MVTHSSSTIAITATVTSKESKESFFTLSPKPLSQPVQFTEDSLESRINFSKTSTYKSWGRKGSKNIRIL